MGVFASAMVEAPGGARRGPVKRSDGNGRRRRFQPGATEKSDSDSRTWSDAAATPETCRRAWGEGARPGRRRSAAPGYAAPRKARKRGRLVTRRKGLVRFCSPRVEEGSGA